MTEDIHLEWKHHTNHLQKMLHKMSSSPEYTDATLVCEDQREFKVHRAILTACSAVFEKIFSFSSQNNPIVYLRGTDGQEIQSVLQFIYLGQTTVPQQRMTEFLNVAKSLKINGISNEEGSLNNEGNSEYVEYMKLKTKEAVKNEESKSNSGNNEGNSEYVEYMKLKTEEAVKNEESKSNSGGERETETEEQVHPSDSGLSVNDSEMSLSDESKHNEIANKPVKQEITIKIKCPHCRIEFSEPSELNKHIVINHCDKKELHKCDQCGKDFRVYKHLSIHIKRTHSEHKPCNVCGNLFSSDYLKKHVQSAHEGTKFKCKLCTSEFSYGSTLSRHMVQVHEERMYTCDICGFTNKHNEKYKVHMKVEHEGFRYSCPHCIYQAKRPDNLRTHILSMHDGIRFSCDQCDYSGSRQNLHTHRKVNNH